MQPAVVRIGGQDFETRSVKEVVAGYAFATHAIRFVSPTGESEIGSLPHLTAARWAYRSYDCIPADAGPLTDRDLLVAAGINGRVDSAAFLAMRSVADEVSAALNQVPLEQTFWDLPPDGVRPDIPPADSRAWALWRMWWLLMGTPNVGVALTHKVLHHKRPALVPLIDNLTVEALRGADGAWKVIYTELNEHRTEWEDLERWFGNQAAAQSGIPLTRLRMHDIVLWCRESHQLTEAQQAGAELLREQ